ncbi:non-heme iron oxygenase ferredoxin subunit [uncultured Pseudokineococcus sp.]|uniref:non-heme iron oxygenase ferredoxin subunit n=1 Tax=uncultured Pseudokineococcus sp. TaxID=1642928 RepID=UPI00261F9AE7|nr:non-heme iron oxygenase ferredoxin subunit [uncultured Pseudokineococcus sp.]
MSLVRVLAAGDLQPGSLRAVDVADAAGTLLPVVVVRDEDGGYHALGDECSHQAVLLSDGEDDAVEGCALECWLHGSRFDLRTGQPSGLPATRPVPVYRVAVDGEDVLVDVEARPDDESTDDESTTPTPTTTGAPGAPAKES